MAITKPPVRTLLVGLMAGLLVTTTPGTASAANLTESFDSVALPGWTQTNLSSPVGSTGWFQGNSAVFPAFAGAATSYIGANYNNTGSTGTISNWLITPMQTTLSNNDTLSFYTRQAATTYADRLEVRMSTNGSCSPGSTSASVGDFTTVLTTVNPGLTGEGYPESWTLISSPLTGVVGNASGCLALRYFVPNAGLNGTMSDYIGIDSFAYTDAAGDATPPSVAVDSGPAGNTTDTTPTFGFSADEAATFQCRVYTQGGSPPAFSACSGPGNTHTPAAALTDGSYTFDVRGTDAGLNSGTATRNFTVTATACTEAQGNLATHQTALTNANVALTTATGTLATANAALSSATHTLSDANAALTKATAKLAKAKAKLKKLKHNGGTAQQIKKAKAKVKKAKAALKQAKAGVAAAQAGVTTAQASVTTAQAGVTTAQAGVTTAQAAVDADQALVDSNCV